MAMTHTAKEQVTLSRWQLNLFTECPRCFWLQNRYGVKQPKGFPMALNIAMDQLLKAEFDAYRAVGTLPPILAEQGVQAKLFEDTEKLAELAIRAISGAYLFPIGHSTLKNTRTVAFAFGRGIRTVAPPSSRQAMG